MKKSFENYNNIRIKIARDEKAKPVQTKCESLAAVNDPYNFEFSSKKDLLATRLIFKARRETRPPVPPSPSAPSVPATVFNVKRKFIQTKFDNDDVFDELLDDKKRLKPKLNLKASHDLDEAICYDSDHEVDLSLRSSVSENISLLETTIVNKEIDNTIKEAKEVKEVKEDKIKDQESTDDEMGREEPISTSSVPFESISQVTSVTSESKRPETESKPSAVQISNLTTKSEPKCEAKLSGKSENNFFDSDDSEEEFNDQRPKFKLKSSASYCGLGKKTSPFKLKASASELSPADAIKKPRRKIFNFKKNHEECKQNIQFNFNPFEETKEDISDNEKKRKETENETSVTLQLRTRHPEHFAMSSTVCSLDLSIHLRNSRKAYECEELGETQAFLDDIYYFVDGLNSDKYRLSDRCLCAIKLAEKCLSSEFRLNLRTSGEYIRKIFNLLKDSTKLQVNFCYVTFCF